MASALNQLIATQQGPNIFGSALQGLAAANQEKQQAQEAELNRQKISLGQHQLAMADRQFAQQKMQEGAKLAANTAIALDKIQDPAQKNALYQRTLKMAHDSGHDITGYPPELDERANEILQYYKAQVYGDEILKADMQRKPQGPLSVSAGSTLIDPATGKVIYQAPEKGMSEYERRSLALRERESSKGGETPSAVKEYEYFKSLSPEEQDTYLKTKRGDRVTAGTEDKIYKTADAAEEQRIKAANYSDLANRYQQASELPSGIRSNFSEWIKEQSGSQDAYTALRKDWAAIKASQVSNNLPPGAASDADVKLALSGFLPDSANPKQVASFMRGIAKMSNMKAEYESFKSDYMSENKSTVGLNQAWKKYAKDNGIGGATTSSSQQESNGKYKVGDVIDHGGKKYRVVGGDLNDPDVEPM